MTLIKFHISFLILFVLFSPIVKGQSCQALFSFSTDSTGLTTFTDLSTVQIGNISNWFWDFGDGTSSTSQNNIHQFNVNGTYLVCLTISTTDSCVITYCDTVFTGNIINPCANFGITYLVINESGAGANDGTIDITVFGSTPPYSYLWSNGVSNEDPINLSTGQYCVTVISSDSCIIDTCFNVGLDSVIVTYLLSGQVYTNSGVLPSGMAKLYETSDSTISIYSTTIINGYYSFVNLNLWNYKLLAIPDSPESNYYASTYFGNEINFLNAYSIPINANTYSVDIYLQDISGIDNLNSQNSIIIYPNPTSNIIYINNIINIKNTTYNICNSFGQCVMGGKLKNNSIELNKLSDGIYLLRIQNSNTLYISKIIKVNIN